MRKGFEIPAFIYYIGAAILVATAVFLIISLMTGNIESLSAGPFKEMIANLLGGGEVF